MRKIIILMVLISMLIIPVRAMNITAPQIPESAEEFMPADTESFGEGVWEVLKAAVRYLMPKLTDACNVCIALIAISLLISVARSLTDRYVSVQELVAALVISGLLLSKTNTMIGLASETVLELSEYGKLLLPVMTAALAAQGGGISSAALYGGTAVFNSLLSAASAKLLIPMTYIYLTLSVAACALGEETLTKLREFVKWLISWCLKITLYLFTGYMSITGVVSGTADASALKVTKLAISGMVPIVGGMLSEASESVLVGASVLKNAAGVYGLLALLAVWMAPFLEIGLQYLLLKGTAALCSGFGSKRISDLIQSFSATMGLLLALTATVCVMLMISTVCFMKGVG